MSSAKYKFHQNCWWDSNRDILYKEKPSKRAGYLQHFDSLSEYRYYRRLLSKCNSNINVKRQVNLLGWRVDFMLEGDGVRGIKERLPLFRYSSQPRLFVEYKGILNSTLKSKASIIQRFGVIIVCPNVKVVDIWSGLDIINSELFLRLLK